MTTPAPKKNKRVDAVQGNFRVTIPLVGETTYDYAMEALRSISVSGGTVEFTGKSLTRITAPEVQPEVAALTEVLEEKASPKAQLEIPAALDRRPK